jgi:hypothetical protein
MDVAEARIETPLDELAWDELVEHGREITRQLEEALPGDVDSLLAIKDRVNKVKAAIA